MKIDKNVPLPNMLSRWVRYPWSEMEVGDSFFTERSNVGNAAASRGRKYGERYTTCKVTENGVKGVRVWRVE